MYTTKDWKDYELLDTSDGERLERWGKYILIRPDPQVIWNADTLFGKRQMVTMFVRKAVAVTGRLINSPKSGR